MVQSIEKEDASVNKETSVANPSRGAVPWALLGWLFLLIVIKWVLASHEEMRGMFAPHDDIWQVTAAARSYWEGNYGPKHLYRLPVYPLFIKLVCVSGIPFRVVMELVYCAGASCLTLALWRIGIPRAVAGLAALAAILYPGSFQVPNRFCAELLLAPLLMFAFAGSLQWWTVRQRRRSWIWAVLAALMWALAWNIRTESIALLPIFGALALCLWFADHAEGWKCTLSRIAMGVGLPLLACVVMATTIKIVNYCRWGLYANTVVTAPGFQAMFKALQKIRPTHPVDYMYVTAEARRYAYAVSPTFKKLEPELESGQGESWAKTSKVWTDKMGLGPLDPHEISAGWFYWALYESAVKTGYKKAPAKADLFFAQIAKEINAALADGRLPKRFVPMAMIDPDFSRWAPRLGTSFQAVYQASVAPATEDRQSVNDPLLPVEYDNLFNNLANRRAYLIQLGPGVVSGWIQSTQDNISSLQLRLADGSPVDALLSTTPRPEMGATALGFNFSVPIRFKKKWEKINLVVSLKSGGEVAWPIPSLIAGKIEHQDHDAVTLGCDQIKAPVPSDIWHAQAQWGSNYYAVVRWIQWPALAGIVLALISLLRGRKTPEFPVVVLLASAVVARFGLFTILDASAWPGDEPRYLFAVMPLLAILWVLGVWLLLTYKPRWKQPQKGARGAKIGS
jgi:hypothetical protein